MEPYLGGLLRYRDLTWAARSGRTTPQGIAALRQALRAVTPQTVVVSLGTNDGPDPGRFHDRMRRVLAMVPARACVVWAAIDRPPRKGPFRALNRVLRRVASADRRLVVVNWDHAVEGGKVALPDGLHPDAPGFEFRSRMIATAVYHGCPARG
jgi:lysophospholipase L1-like esterase